MALHPTKRNAKSPSSTKPRKKANPEERKKKELGRFLAGKRKSLPRGLQQINLHAAGADLAFDSVTIGKSFREPCLLFHRGVQMRGDCPVQPSQPPKTKMMMRLRNGQGWDAVHGMLARCLRESEEWDLAWSNPDSVTGGHFLAGVHFPPRR